MIYVTLPVHEERHTIGPLLWKIRQVFSEQGRDFRILVVNDASEDSTADVLEPYRRVLPLTVMENEERCGYAASLERAMREAVAHSEYPRRDGVLALQADFTDAPEAIPDMLRRFQGGADLVIGRGVRVTRPPRTIRLARLGGSVLSRRLPFPEEVEDPLSGFRLYRLSSLKRTFAAQPEPAAPLLQHEGLAANLELLLAVAPHVRSVEHVDVPLNYNRRYRPSRFRALPELWGVYRATRDERLKRMADTTGT